MVTLGPPSRANAYPIATTWSPTRTLPGLANVAATKFCASTLSNAKSLPASAAKTTAVTGSVSPANRTRTSVAPSTTWALVKISPSLVTTTPVPVDSPSPITPLTRLEIVTTLLASRVAAAATPVICDDSSGDTTGAAVTWVYSLSLIAEPESICVASTPPIRPAANDTATPIATKRINRERRPRRALSVCSATSIGAGGGNTKLMNQFYR